jgi:penicillin-binding protein 1A
MTDPSGKGPLTAGERLVPAGRDARPDARRPKRPERDRKPSRKGKGPLGRVLGVFGFLGALVVLAGVVGAGAGYVLYRHYSADLPDQKGLVDYQPKVMSRVYAGDSRLLLELATERRMFVPIGAIPEMVKRAFISAEDQNFYQHKGVDPLAIARAALTDALHYGSGRRPVGASTITQQVAKNMLLGNEVSLARKAREAILAWRIEQTLSKDRILELYLNEIYLGMQSYGVAAAAQSYFNKTLDELTLPEAAFLAALPKAPNNYNPFRFPDAARDRRNWVLDRMADDRVITAEQATAAKATPLVPAAFRRPETVTGADYFAEEERRQLVDKFGADETTQGGLVVRTSLDPTLQAAADKALRDGLMRYDHRRGGWRGPAGQLDLGPALRTGWATALAGFVRPPGMLADWQLAAVLEAGEGDAKLGILDRGTAGAPPQPRVLPLLLADLAWARPALPDSKLGPTPRRVSDVVKPGDVVMVEAAPAVPAQGRTAARPARLLLEQIPRVQGALVAVDPATGRVLAMAGGWSFETSQFNRATQANRQPGSSFKPMVFLTAMEANISPSQRVLDAPFVVDLGAAGKWRPNNDEMNFSGPVPLHVALEKSLNLVTVRLAAKLGMERVAKTAIAFHMVDDMPRVLPAALGAVDTTVLREAGAYAALDEGGREVVPTLIDSVQDGDGHVIWRAPAPRCDGCDDPTRQPELTDTRKRIADAASVAQVVTMMQGVVQRGTGAGAGAGINHALAGKTGTSQDFVDNWFSGFSPDLVTAVWVGFDTPTTLGNNEFGATNAAPIWHDFMAAALKNRPNLKFVVPPGVTLASWDSGSGTVTDAFKPGQVPGASEPVIDIATATAHTDTAPGGGQGAAADATPAQAPRAAGVDSGLGGLY